MKLFLWFLLAFEGCKAILVIQELNNLSHPRTRQSVIQELNDLLYDLKLEAVSIYPIPIVDLLKISAWECFLKLIYYSSMCPIGATMISIYLLASHDGVALNHYGVVLYLDKLLINNCLHFDQWYQFMSHEIAFLWCLFFSICSF